MAIEGAVRRWAGVCLILALALMPACGSGGAKEGDDPAEAESAAPASDEEASEPEEAEPEESGSKKKETTTSVSATPVERGRLVVPVVAEGTLRARHAADIKFEIAGRIEQLFVKEGQRVRKGQKLVELDDREVRLGLEEARARFLQGLGQLAVEEEGYAGKKPERTLEEQLAELKRMEDDGLVTRRERLDRELDLGMEAVRNGAYRRELLEVRSGLSTARADIARLELDLERTVIHAPFSGVMTGVALTSRQRVQAGDLLGRLVDDVNVEADVGVLESDLAGIEVGRAVRLTIPALGETLDLDVDVIRPEIDAESRTCGVLIRLSDPAGRYKPGMFVRAAIAGQVYEDRTLVPREAILTRDSRPMLFRVEDDRAKWVYVQLGLRNDHVVEIARVDQGGPLDPGTPVVVDNHLTLTHDAKVKIRKEVPLADPWLAGAD